MLVSAPCAVRAAAHRCAIQQGMRLTGRQEVIARAHQGGERGRPPAHVHAVGHRGAPGCHRRCLQTHAGQHDLANVGMARPAPTHRFVTCSANSADRHGRFNVQEPAQRCQKSGAAQGQPQHDSAQWQAAPAVPAHERGGEHAPTRGQGSQSAAACLFMGSPAITPSHGPPSGDDGRVAFSHKGTPEQAGVGCFTGPWRAALRERWAHATGCP